MRGIATKQRIALALLALGVAGALFTRPRPVAATTAPPPSSDSVLRDAFARAGIRPVAEPAVESSDLVALGRTLFFDVRLSGNRNVSCSSCHYHRSASTDGRSLARGEGARGVGKKREGGKLLGRRAPPLYNRAFLDRLFWDGRVARTPGASALEAQALLPPLSAEEMRGEPGTNELASATSDEAVWSAIMKRLLADDHLRKLFERAYPGTPGLVSGHAARAIAAFEAAQWTAVWTPLDAYLAGDSSALGPEAKRGALLFAGKANCVRCHSGPQLTDESFHALAVPQIGPGHGEPHDDRGLALVTGSRADDYRFRTPPLRNVAITGPWMHDGCFTSLEAVVRHHLDPRASLASYNPAQVGPELEGLHDVDPARQAARAAALDPLVERVALDANEVAALVSFLEALTDASQAEKINYRMGPMMMEGMMPPMMANMWEKDPKKKGMAMPLMMGQ